MPKLVLNIIVLLCGYIGYKSKKILVQLISLFLIILAITYRIYI